MTFRWITSPLAIVPILTWATGQANLHIQTELPTAEVAGQYWHFTTQSPTADWFTSSFDDRSWKLELGGFGVSDTPGVIVHTVWKTSDIWLRKQLHLNLKKTTYVLRLHHDDDAEIYINGRLLSHETKWVTEYHNFPLPEWAISALQSGPCTLAIHCHQVDGGQYIDAGIMPESETETLPYGDQNESRSLSERNPIIPGLFADPSIAKFGDTFYLYATTDGFGWPTGRWVVWKSKDFVHWSFKGESFKEITGQQNWAPGVPVYRTGKYWMPYTIHGREGHIAVADKPEGPFHDAFGKAIVSDIDSEIFVDTDQTPYIVWGRPKQHIDLLKSDLSGVASKGLLYDFGMGYTEGPFVFKRNGIYYLCGANLGYAEYRINYAMGKSVLGPFIKPNKNFLVEPKPQENLWGTGHGNVVRLDDKDHWAVVYLRSRMGERVDPFMEDGNVYRQVCADRFAFNSDGTIRTYAPTRTGLSAVGKPIHVGKSVALGQPTSASSSLKRYGPEKAVDGGMGTRWIVGDQMEKSTWWQVDLGRGLRLDHTEISFNYPTEITPYQLFGSIDGDSWFLVADHSKDSVYESPKVDRLVKPVRYLKVQFISTVKDTIPAGIWEFGAFTGE